LRINHQSMKITIIGGGIAGLTTAIALNKIGISTQIFEAAPSIKAIGAGIVLAANAMQGFQKLGISAEIIEKGRLCPSFNIYDQKGKIITKTDSIANTEKYGADNFTIHRANLHQLLLSKINPNDLFTNKKALKIVQNGDKITIVFQDGTSHQTDYLIVSDGINSPIRQQLMPDSTPRYAGYTCWRAVIDNTKLNLTETSETWGVNGRMGLVPLADNKIYWFACINAPQNDPKMKAYKVADLQQVFKDFHDPIPSVLAETQDKNLLWNDIIDLKPIHQYAFDNIVLIGDAAHATTPNMGQGACQAIEDAVVLADEMQRNNDFKQAFKAFEKRRMKRTHFIINSSWSLGKAAHFENKVLAEIRNFVFRSVPKSITEKQFKTIYEVDF
jgi:2-polyprenyl-6-methoxyphenol hydroxylase-like FAD-dependent oxidoreductase